MHRRDIPLALLASSAGAATSPSAPQFAPLDARRYGLSDTSSGAANAAACRKAIAAAAVRGGTVQLPEGTFDMGAASDVIDIPQQVVVKGAGMSGTRLMTAADGKNGGLFRLGGAASGALKYGCQLSDLAIVMSGSGGTAVQLVETAAARVANLYIEGPISSRRSTTGVLIDGGRASSFFNVVSQVVCNHVRIGFDLMTSGSTVPTQTLFSECTVYGDATTDAASTGLRVRANCGNATIWVGGNLEYCGIGFHGASGCSSVTVLGVRLEGNNADIVLDSRAKPWTFIGCCNMLQSRIIDNSGTGTTYLGCVELSGNPFGTQLSGNNTLRAHSPADTPARIVGHPAQSTAVLSVESSAGTPVLQAAPDGRLGFFGASLHAKPVCTGSRSEGAALESLLGAMAALGLIDNKTTP